LIVSFVLNISKSFTVGKVRGRKVNGANDGREEHDICIRTEIISDALRTNRGQ
jgi:hypothetical protein